MLYIKKKTIFRVLDNKRSICKLLLDHFHVKYEIMEVGAEGRGFFLGGGLQAPFVYKCGRVL